MKRRTILAILTLIIGAFMLLSSGAIPGEALAKGPSSAFRKQFILKRMSNQVAAQEALIKLNKDAVPGEIESLIADALDPENTVDEKLYLLDNGASMASIYAHHFGDDTYINKINALQTIEIAKMKQKESDIEQWKFYDGLKGSMVMMEHIRTMEIEGVDPALYPHSLHRMFFRCKACHEDQFIAKRGANDISHSNFKQGKQCAVCHNGETSFDVKGSCLRCHPKKDDLVERGSIEIDHELVGTAAARLGATWEPGKLEEPGKLPLDNSGAIDWLSLEQNGVIHPLAAIPGVAPKEATHDKDIVFKVTEAKADDVAFSHSMHTRRIDCTTCHERIFTPVAGSAKITKENLGQGQFCGNCHGKVSFPFTNCDRCHNVDPEETLENAAYNKD